MGERVGAVPGDLLGDEVVGPAEGEDLRQRRRVPEHVGDPRLATGDAVVLAEEPLAVQKLAGHRLAAGQVAVGLHPHAAEGHPPSGLDRIGDAVGHRRILVDHPLVLNRLRAAEAVVRVVGDQVE